ncbi:MurR/RpiR family transcriptional regulator [Marinobacterium stanieri]|uniref:Transcriptional regulator, RpiR family n=1 Tax=Marinobacterium stanieri TaxID=49186 RepID=A0A1N6NYA4_9GAMM|nr:MurR/RpiR family transcriptional regulator [Marinobacterium stanieri]SIP97118.1 transcriptional regulator, RpiR family [Marinobacterium stanieri]
MTTPEAPTNMQELRDLMLEIAHGRSQVRLGPKARKAMQEILEMDRDPALLSITSLSAKLKVNSSTISRLARSLGYPNFGALQQVLLSSSTPAPFYSDHARTALDSELPSHQLAHQLCRDNQDNIGYLMQHFDGASFDKAVALINETQRVSVYGIRQFHAMASFLVYGLRMIRSDVHLLGSSDLGVAEAIASLDPQDLLIVTSCAPYSRGVIEVAQVAREKGMPVLAITDGLESPLVELSNVALFAPHESSFISNSLTSFILLAECLINGCAAASPERSEQALAERDRMIQAFNIE